MCTVYVSHRLNPWLFSVVVTEDVIPRCAAHMTGFISWMDKQRMWIKRKQLRASQPVLQRQRQPDAEPSQALRRMTKHLSESDFESVWEYSDPDEVVLPDWLLVARPNDVSKCVRHAVSVGHPVIVAREPGPIVFPPPWGSGTWPDSYEADYEALKASFA